MLKGVTDNNNGTIKNQKHHFIRSQMNTLFHILHHCRLLPMPNNHPNKIPNTTPDTIHIKEPKGLTDIIFKPTMDAEPVQSTIQNIYLTLIISKPTILVT